MFLCPPQTTGRTSETRLLLLLPALPPRPPLCWRSAGRATSQRSLQASFMDLPQLVKPPTRLTTSTALNPENMPPRTPRAACCSRPSSASWSEVDPLRSSPGLGAIHRLRGPQTTPRSHRWCTGQSSTQGSTRIRLDPGTASRRIHLVAGRRSATHPPTPLVRTGKFQSYGGPRQEVCPREVHQVLATKRGPAPWGGWGPCPAVCWTCSTPSLCPSLTPTWSLYRPYR